MRAKKICACLLIGWLFLIRISYTWADPIDQADFDDVGSTETVQVTAKTKDAIGNMLLQALSLMGISYRWGGNTPQTGMDCSGFIRYVFKKSLGINLPRTASEMAKVGKRVSLDSLEPGDLLFFNTRRGSNTHIGMYIGNNKFIQSPHTGATIEITELNRAWRAKINGAKRIIEEEEEPNGVTRLEEYQEINDEALPVKRRVTRLKHNHHYKVNRLKGHHVGVKVSRPVKTHSVKAKKVAPKRKHHAHH